MAQSKQRHAGIELLRILAMLMVVMLHCLSKGQVLPDMTGRLTANGYLAWILETLSIVAVNVYILISGFFLPDSSFQTGRLLGLLCQILFYSILIPVILLAFGVFSVKELTIYKLLQYLLPVQMEHYWFASAYVFAYLFSPVIRCAVRHMTQKQLKGTIFFLLLFFSVSKSVLPVRLEMDHLGYDTLWFLCVYLCAGYLRLYGTRHFTGTKAGIRKALCGYLAFLAAILGMTFVIRAIYLRFGILKDFLIAGYHYNHIFNLGAAVCLFLVFYQIRIKDGWISRLILKIAPATFGVYLFHEHLELRYRWPSWFGMGADAASASPLFFVLHCLGAVLGIYVLGTVIDLLRARIFKGITFLVNRGWIKKGLDQLDSYINDSTISGAEKR